ncbi:hypothetical protein FHS95_000359 [Sphingomonas naasensis]|uniref:hypothetical protein n=1 Tax=Sphingomonas naasensis TaxID=1344951 RepID=UPI001ABA168C|nr:hypothetical protein [Sphingomonas naasensis]NIJ18690.1 hypothetical protein [Sphingomonas naasensis]
MNEEDRLRVDQRAKTLVIRCWYERGDDDVVWLRGTVRDLSRGRSLAFEGLESLLLKLPALIGDGVPPARLERSPE